MFKRILVANRGEIACRVMRTARRMGVETVAVYSNPDANSMHVGMSDAAVNIGGTAASDSYLRGDRVIEAALATGAEAIHPGYGFLSENDDFADKVASAGLKLIGPPAQAMRDMGSKDAAKRLMDAAGVPLLPGYHGDDQDLKTLEREALACGLGDGKPVLFKAVKGGGGKGMRVVDTVADLVPSIESARHESLASFLDDRLLVERYLPSARHIEVQVMCDQHGNGIYLFERDCSLQRRHQKVIEEAPAPGVDAKLRAALGEAAVKAAMAVNYEGAGTVEFIADAANPNDFFFMEMNTRLQVEHPISEMVTGMDLVELQLLVAAGHPLPLTQDQLSLSGWSFEARVYAESPEAGPGVSYKDEPKAFFLPGSGVLEHLRTPPEYGDPYAPADVRATAAGHAVRIDTGVAEGDEISVYYDPMIAKLIVRGADRPAALQLLRRALAQWETVGLSTNVPFMRRVCDTEAFSAGEVHTAFIDEHAAELLPEAPPPPSSRTLKLAALYWMMMRSDELRASTSRTSSVWSEFPFTRLGGGLCGGAGASPLRLQPLGFDGMPSGDPTNLGLRRVEEHGSSAAATYEMAVLAADGDAAADSAWSTANILEWDASDRSFRATLDGTSVRGSASVTAETADNPAGVGATIHLFVEGESTSVLVSDVMQQARQRLSASGGAAAAAASSILSPMPGKIVRVLVSPGQEVKAGEQLVVLEAMKMEHVMKAPNDATVENVNANVGDVVNKSAVLLSFAKDAEGEAAAA